jgi:post-segregation antitoxin (ccd killing protein)
LGVRKPLNVTVSEDLVARAKALGINVSRAAEEGIEQAIRAYRQPGFLKGKVGPVPASFFEPLPEQELRRWRG